MDGIFGRVFGPCFRGWIQPEQTNGNKYIDYAPNRKWKYDDKNLIKELTKDQVNSWDVMDLNEDEDLDVKIASNGKLQLHDNVFINPLSTNEEDNNNANKEKDEAETRDGVTGEVNPVNEESEQSLQNASSIEEDVTSNNKGTSENDGGTTDVESSIEMTVNAKGGSEDISSGSSAEEAVVIDEEVKLVVEEKEEPE
ncbi:uncharacterized protein [Clytia hemisphaerica]|uniref:Uncharacterized protein n=1 Tax=Clytia hemisphaerica TaxID=252671 RepID=A0A7M5UK40_9CNID|eukprot:TCONS_00060052-protein